MGFDDEDDDDKDEECGDDSEDSDNGEEYGNDNMEPSNEMISKRMEMTHISSFSVLEGVGRELKGRDLSKVRNAILTNTGFLESP
ncbi:unnamed protein product [Linum trigynum]|uniref:Uncharacterized protein n=1 Tax=Linum trigynum TaxID=586398 RepID=A0AAV2DAM1_9ROSI